MCDDIEATVAELEAKGAEFAGPIEDYDFGRGATMSVPAADDILVYEPHHPKAYKL